MVSASLVGLAYAVPAPMDHAGLWTDFFDQHYAGNRTAARIWRSSGIITRHGAVDPRREDISAWSTGARMRRYAAEAMPLAKEAVSGALADAGLDPRDVGLLAVVTCTGYGTPGIDIMVARDLGMDPGVQRLLIGHMGCYAALPGLGAVADFVVARGRPAVLLCLELTSLHVQPASTDRQQMVAHALFGDAATAVVLAPGVGGVEVLDLAARTDAATSDHMTWEVTDLGFRMGLSARVPDVLRGHVQPVIGDLLDRHGLTVDDVAGWAVHPGGPRILQVFAAGLGLPEEALRPSYDVLRDFGNCSSATVLLVLERLLRGPDPVTGPIVLAAFGPGLTLYAAVLHAGPG